MHSSTCCITRQRSIWHSKLLSSTERCWSHPGSDQSSPSPDQPRQDSRTQIRRVMAARQQKPAAAADGSAEAKRMDHRANEKKCCELFVFPPCVNCWLIIWSTYLFFSNYWLLCTFTLTWFIIIQRQCAVNCTVNQIFLLCWPRVKQGDKVSTVWRTFCHC